MKIGAGFLKNYISVTLSQTKFIDVLSNADSTGTAT